MKIKFLCYGLAALALNCVALFALDTGSNTSPVHQKSSTSDQREHQSSRNPIRASEFNNVLHAGAPSRCEEVRAPEPLTTPNPLDMEVRDQSRVKISFIIGTDGRVHSPLILESAGPVGDRNVLLAVRSWRFRPATCNGIPTEIEAKIQFSNR